VTLLLPLLETRWRCNLGTRDGGGSLRRHLYRLNLAEWRAADCATGVVHLTAAISVCAWWCEQVKVETDCPPQKWRECFFGGAHPRSDRRWGEFQGL